MIFGLVVAVGFTLGHAFYYQDLWLAGAAILLNPIIWLGWGMVGYGVYRVSKRA